MVRFHTAPQGPPQCLPLGFQKCLGESVNGWSACGFASKLLGWRPKALEPGHSLTAVEEAALLGSKSFLNDSPTASLHTPSPSSFPALLHPRAYLQISARPKACFGGQVELPIWIALTHRQSYVPSQQGLARARLWEGL